MNIERYILTGFLILLEVHLFSQEQNSGDRKPDTLFFGGYGEFEKYAFILDGKMIERNTLTDYPGAKLNKIHLETYRYPGELYFDSPKRLISPPPDADAPAYFINSRQVTFYDIQKSDPEAYTRVKKSERDTIIDDILYKGTIHVETEEDFFARHVTLSNFLSSRYPQLPIGNTLIHLQYRGYNVDFVSVNYHNRQLYHIVPRNLRPVKAGRIRLAEGTQYIVHLIDTGYLLDTPKALLMLENPSILDIASPCYLTNPDTTDVYIRTGGTEVEPLPKEGVHRYLQRLSETLRLPGNKDGEPSLTDSVGIEFIVTRSGMLTALKATGPGRPELKPILYAIKQRSCDWSFAAFSGRGVFFRRKITIHYTLNEKGNILSLDNLTFRRPRH